MNRRCFLSAPFAIMNPSNTNKVRPYTHASQQSVGTLTVKNDNYCIFTSENQKFVAQILYEDRGKSVRMYSVIDWEDPVTKEQLQKKSVDSFILDRGGQM